MSQLSLFEPTPQSRPNDTRASPVLFRVQNPDLLAMDVSSSVDGVGVMRCHDCNEEMPWNPHVNAY